ncbi:hypothetical protein FBU59_004695 [Linderina macrospora]|uniref:Uncharacterized protein n=1 Tax=Linderina macrospora TaxID=4868 RepID=A0ACC1J4S9_9FUNG|nr:hypothetical protein FBU59_004695 [Linderina macrospora]
MRYSLADSRFQSIGHPAHPNPETSRFYEMLLERRLSSLHMAQAFNPLPVKTCIRFSQHLTHLQLNADLVATNNEVALIPVDQLRRLEMVHIDGVAPWHKFVRSGNTVKFTNLECLIMRFHNTAHLRLQFPGYDLILQLPSLKFLTVFNSGYAYRDLYTFFAQYQLTSVNISERFEHFGMIGPKIMQSTKVMRLMNLETSSRITIKCSSEVFQELFAYTAGIEKLSLAGLYYPMPMCILLTWLVSLEISVCIADYGSIVNLISNLPYLSELCICCMSMDRRDAQYTIFKDLDMAFKMNDLLYNPQDRFAISHALRRLEISTVRSLKMIPIVALACRLPKLCQLGVDKGYINGLRDLFRATKELSNGILIHEFKPLS